MPAYRSFTNRRMPDNVFCIKSNKELTDIPDNSLLFYVKFFFFIYILAYIFLWML
jgi:hypothetical protein